MEPFRLTRGNVPLLVSMPHVGTHLPPDLAARMTPEANALPDTDWHVDRLYDFLGELGASAIAATHSRYVIDLNRAPDGAPLYPGASETGLCPTTTFDDMPIYAAGAEPDAREIEVRRTGLWQPYHDALGGELEAIRGRHGVAVLWDAHSIRSRVPRFFEGSLPDLNLGTGGGVSADPDLVARVAAAAAASRYSQVVDGRFKGGFITRHYGDPAAARHALQLELSQATYMVEAPPYGFRDDLAARIRPVLRDLLQAVIAWAEELR